MAAAKKSKVNPKLIAIVVVVLAVVGVVGYMMMNKNGGSMTANNPISSIKDALSASVSMECEFTDPEGRQSKAFIKNGAMRLDYTGKTNEEGSGGMISRDKKLYIWNGKEGTVMEVPESEEGVEDSTTETSSKEEMVEEMEQYKDQCKTSVVSDSVFTPPADVVFKDMSEMMKTTMPEGSAGGTQQDYEKMMEQYKDQAPVE